MPLFRVTKCHASAPLLVEPLLTAQHHPSHVAATVPSEQKRPLSGGQPVELGGRRSVLERDASTPRPQSVGAAPPEAVAATLSTYALQASHFVTLLYQSEPHFAAWASERGGTSLLYRPKHMQKTPRPFWGNIVGAFRQTTERHLFFIERARSSRIEDYFRIVELALLAAHEFNRLLVFQLEFKDDVHARVMLASDHNQSGDLLMVEGLCHRGHEQNMWRLSLHSWDSLLKIIETSPLRGVKTMEAVVHYWHKLELCFASVHETLNVPEYRFVLPADAKVALQGRKVTIRRHIDTLLMGFGINASRHAWPAQRPPLNTPQISRLTALGARPTTQPHTVLQPVAEQRILCPTVTSSAPRLLLPQIPSMATTQDFNEFLFEKPSSPTVVTPAESSASAATTDHVLPIQAPMPSSAPHALPLTLSLKTHPPVAEQDVSEEVRKLMDTMWRDASRQNPS